MKKLRLFLFNRQQLAAIFLLLFASVPATAALVTVESFYTDRNTASSQTVTSTATFDDSGLTGVGVEFVQLSSIEFFFTSVGFSQMPNILPVAPGDPFPDGSFLARYEAGSFQYLASVPGISGFAVDPAEVFPSVGISNMWVFLEQGGLLQRVGLTSSGIGRYKLERQQIVAPSAIPIPAAWLLFGSALAGLLGLRRRGISAIRAGASA